MNQKKILRNIIAFAFVLSLFYSAGYIAAAQQDKKSDIRPENISNDALLKQNPEWYKSEEAIRIADNILLYQLGSGGWQKNIDMSENLSPQTRKNIAETNKKSDTATIDNDTTTLQIVYLAKVYNAAKYQKAQKGALKGLNYLFNAQLDNGGWAQDYPDPQGYHAHITFNDNAMINVLTLLRGIADGTDKDFDFIAKETRVKADTAVKKGIDCILKAQIKVNGRLTGWCAQYDEKTLLPADARAYEKKSISGLEGVSILKFLMEIDNPSPQIIEAVQSAVAWFNEAAINGIKLNKYNEKDDDFDFTVEKDPAAEPIWARFYEIETNKPIFCGRDGVIKYDVIQIEQERRYNYRWYTYAPAVIFKEHYPKWQTKWAPGKNVL